MRVFLDTNVLIAASVRQHPHFSAADAVVRRCMHGEDEGIIHAHSILEFHSAATQLPGGLAVPPAYVPMLLREGLLPWLRMVTLAPDAVLSVQTRAAEMGIIGGMVYDLFHVAAAEAEDVERLYTFNVPHFRQLAAPGFADRIVSPLGGS